MEYVEKISFVIRLEASAEFPPDYDGDADGYAWAAAFDQVKGRIYAQVLRELSLQGAFTIVPANRGLSADEEVTVRCRLKVD